MKQNMSLVRRNCSRFFQERKILFEEFGKISKQLWLFEKLVSKKSIKVNEFLNCEEIMTGLLTSLRIEPELIDRIAWVTIFDKIRFQDRNLILLNREDKQVWLESLKKLKKIRQ